MLTISSTHGHSVGPTAVSIAHRHVAPSAPPAATTSGLEIDIAAT
jgi:hypothetical protein